MRPVGWRIALYFGLVFAAGIGLGILAQRYVIPPPVRADTHQHRDSERFRKAMVEELTKRLNLDSGQVKQLDLILDESRKSFQAFRDRHTDEMKVIYAAQHEQIAAMLRPDQRVAYEKLKAERDAEMKKRDDEAKKPQAPAH